ncbi:hypothetical protein [Muricoccus radiodurans]
MLLHPPGLRGAPLTAWTAAALAMVPRHALAVVVPKRGGVAHAA